MYIKKIYAIIQNAIYFASAGGGNLNCSFETPTSRQLSATHVACNGRDFIGSLLSHFFAARGRAYAACHSCMWHKSAEIMSCLRAATASLTARSRKSRMSSASTMAVYTFFVSRHIRIRVCRPSLSIIMLMRFMYFGGLTSVYISKL